MSDQTQMQISAGDSWLVSNASNKHVIIELFIMAILPPPSDKFKAQICSGSGIGRVEWFTLNAWTFIEKLPTQAQPVNDSQGISSPQG